MDASGVIAYYVMDGNRPLTATTGNDITSYLYGLGVIGEETDDWSYGLPDGTNTQRQLTDAFGEVTYAARYTPWGDTLDASGTGNFAFGYFGGLMDAATGLLYVGDGQYYDPSTGRFLTRNARPNSANPYLPFDPTGAMLGPLGLLALVLGSKKKKSKVDVFLFMLVFAVVSGMTLSACILPGQPTPTPTPTPTLPPPNVGITPGATQTSAPTSTPEAPTTTPTATSCDQAINLFSPIPEEYLMIASIESWGFTLAGAWKGQLLNNLWEALSIIGYPNILSWLNGKTATLIVGGAKNTPPGKYSGFTQGSVITFYQNNTYNAPINFLHEFGHLFDNLWGDYFTKRLEKTEFTLQGEYRAGWDGTTYKSLPREIVNSQALYSSQVGGGRAWQQDGGVPHFEDWADIFANAIIGNINRSSDLGGQMHAFFEEMEYHVTGCAP